MCAHTCALPGITVYYYYTHTPSHLRAVPTHTRTFPLTQAHSCTCAYRSHSHTHTPAHMLYALISTAKADFYLWNKIQLNKIEGKCNEVLLCEKKHAVLLAM